MILVSVIKTDTPHRVFFDFFFTFRGSLNGGTVPPFSMHLGGTGPPFSMHIGGTVHTFHMHLGATVPPFSMHPGGTPSVYIGPNVPIS